MSFIELLEILWKLSQNPTFSSTRHDIEISAVSCQIAMHVYFSATRWVCSIKLRDSSFTQRESSYILMSATCRSAWHVDIVESRAQDISTAFIMCFSGSRKKLFSFGRTSTLLPIEVVFLSSAVLLRHLSFSGNFKHIPLILRSSYPTFILFFT